MAEEPAIEANLQLSVRPRADVAEDALVGDVRAQRIGIDIEAIQEQLAIHGDAEWFGTAGR
jgi:hypothetical protein